MYKIALALTLDADGNYRIWSREDTDLEFVYGDDPAGEMQTFLIDLNMPDICPGVVQVAVPAIEDPGKTATVTIA